MRRVKHQQIRKHLLDWMKRSSPMLWARLEADLIDEDVALTMFAGPRLRLNQETERVEAVQMFRTTDGQTFETEAEAAAHQSALESEAKVDAFIAGREWKKGQATHAKNVIMQFLAAQG